MCSTRAVAGLRPLDQVLARQAEAGLVEAGEQDVVGLGRAHRVVQRQRRIRVHHRALGLDPELPQHGLGHVDAALGGVAALLDVDQLADDRQVLRGDHREVVGAGVRRARGRPCSSLRPPATSLRKTRTRLTPSREGGGSGSPKVASSRFATTSEACSEGVPTSVIADLALAGVDRRILALRLLARLEPSPRSCGCSHPGPLGLSDLGLLAGHDHVPRAGDAVLVGTADDARDLIEVEDRAAARRPATRSSWRATGSGPPSARSAS